MKLKIPEGNFDGYVFDCDGTLADTMPAHYLAWCEALERHGCEFPEPYFYSLGGVPTEKIVGILNERNGLSMPVRETAAEKEALFLKHMPDIRPIEAVVSIMKALHGRKPLAVASGGHREIVILTLKTLGILEYFDAIVGVEDYERGKPAPDPFLEAARRLGVAPECCLAFEDTHAGVTSAQAAGMQTVLVPTAFNAEG